MRLFRRTADGLVKVSPQDLVSFDAHVDLKREQDDVSALPSLPSSLNSEPVSPTTLQPQRFVNVSCYRRLTIKERELTGTKPGTGSIRSRGLIGGLLGVSSAAVLPTTSAVSRLSTFGNISLIITRNLKLHRQPQPQLDS